MRGARRAAGRQPREAARSVPRVALAVLILLSVGVAGCATPGTSPGGTGTPVTPANGSPRGSARDVSLDGAGLPTLAPDEVRNRVPPRVRLPGLGIDLPVVAPPRNPDHFPACNVAEYLPGLSRPGHPGATFIYAHARPGMFLPILDAARSNRGHSLLGIRVDVFTSDDRRFTYEITDVRRHVRSLDFAYRISAEQLILQTSEGPVGTPGKTVVIAVPRSEEPATADDARPEAHPVTCE
jgi:hypothetical protein